MPFSWGPVCAVRAPREGQIAFKDEKHGLRLMKHEKRARELDYATLSGADLSGARLTHASVRHTDLTQARLLEAEMAHVRDQGCHYTLAER